MFHRATDASKVALVALVALLDAHPDTLIDVQWATPHLSSLGVVEVRPGRTTSAAWPGPCERPLPAAFSACTA